MSSVEDNPQWESTSEVFPSMHKPWALTPAPSKKKKKDRDREEMVQWVKQLQDKQKGVDLNPQI